MSLFENDQLEMFLRRNVSLSDVKDESIMGNRYALLHYNKIYLIIAPIVALKGRRSTMVMNLIPVFLNRVLFEQFI